MAKRKKREEKKRREGITFTWNFQIDLVNHNCWLIPVDVRSKASPMYMFCRKINSKVRQSRQFTIPGWKTIHSWKPASKEGSVQLVSLSYRDLK